MKKMKRMFRDDCKYVSLEDLLDAYAITWIFCLLSVAMATIAVMMGVL